MGGQGSLTQSPGSCLLSHLLGSLQVDNQEQFSLTLGICTAFQVGLYAYSTSLSWQGPPTCNCSSLWPLNPKALFIMYPVFLSHILSLGSISCPMGWSWREFGIPMNEGQNKGQAFIYTEIKLFPSESEHLGKNLLLYFVNRISHSFFSLSYMKIKFSSVLLIRKKNPEDRKRQGTHSAHKYFQLYRSMPCLCQETEHPLKKGHSESGPHLLQGCAAGKHFMETWVFTFQGSVLRMAETSAACRLAQAQWRKLSSFLLQHAQYTTLVILVVRWSTVQRAKNWGKTDELPLRPRRVVQ